MGWAKQQTGLAGIKLSILAASFVSLIFVQASASVIDRPFFRANAVVIIFSGGDFVENNGEAPLVHDFVLLDNVTSGTEGNDLIAQNGVPVNFPFDPISDGTSGGWPFQITNQTFGGQYNNNPSFQMLDANDSYTAFGIDNSTDIDLFGTQVRFAWFFVASNTAFDLYNANGFTLDDISGGQTKVYDGGRKTARIPGSIAQQATGFASVYRLRGSPITGNNYDFSLGTGILSADVTYTVFAP